MKTVYIDFETRSMKELRGAKSVGLYNYATDQSTIALMLGWAIDEGEVHIWFCDKEPMPDELRKALTNEKVNIVAFNSGFERAIFKHVLGLALPASRFQDPQASARYLSLPADLEDVSLILGLPRDYAKEEDGKRLIGIFCKPTKKKKKRGEPVEYYFRDAESDPEDWAKFVEYCKQDVIAEREVMRRLMLLGVLPLPAKERAIWIFDQTVNERGMPVDTEFVSKAFKIADRAKKAAISIQNKLTGLENSNSNDQMLPWVQDRGYKPDSLVKELVKAELEFNTDLSPLCREVLTNRKAAASTSYKKLETLMRQVCPDGRARNLFIYMGSSRCGRWSSAALQFHNMARPDERFEDEENINWARAMVYAEDYDAIESWFGNPTPEKPDPGAVLLVIKSLIRTAFVAKEDKEMAVADENAIETRVAGWISSCEPLLKVFKTYYCLEHYETEPHSLTPGKCSACGKKLRAMDPYLDFAVKMTQIPYITLARWLYGKDPALKAKAKKYRQDAKPAVLGCVYRLGGGQMGQEDGVPKKFGYWGYAANMGVHITQDQAHETVDVFRESYKEIVEFWYLLEKVIAEVLDVNAVNVKREVGPGGCIKIDKINIRGRHPILRIQLPSGRYLHYMDARIEDSLMPWQKKIGTETDEEGNSYDVMEDVYKPTLVYAGQNQKTHQWGVVFSHGGKIFENIVQGIARDVLAHILLICENERDLPICGHVHDEGIVEKVADPFAPGVREMEWIMAQPIDWAPGLPLKGDGFECRYYHK